MENAEPQALSPSRRLLWSGSLLVAATCAVVLLATSPGLPMVWDEGNAILRAERISHWFARWAGGDVLGATGPLGAEAIAQDWPFTNVMEGHPAFYGLVIALGRWPSGAWLAPLTSCRLGPILLFAAAAGAIFYRLWRDQSLVAAMGAVTTLMLLPRMFAHAHFASFDGPLTSCWVLTWATFPPALGSRRWTLVWGIALGMVLSTKATGWLAPLPFFAWALLYRDRAGLRTLGLGIPVALAVFFTLNPPLWHHPIASLATFLDLNLHRAQHGWNISTQFLGRMYNLDFPLPWYNTLFWTAITVPVGLLALATVGIVHTLWQWRTERLGMLVLVNWLTLVIVRALPQAPPHDGIRLFLSAFAFLAILAGIGTARTLAILAPLARTRPKLYRTATVAVLLVYVGSGSNLVWYAPQWLSYYNLLIGGLPGATAAGMEPTYYWDGLDDSVLVWLERHTTPEEKVRFGAGPTDNLQLMRRWGKWNRGYLAADRGTFRWYVLQRRPSAWQAADLWLLEHAQPAFRKTIRTGGIGPWRLDDVLVEVYPFEQYVQAQKESAAAP